VAEVDAAKKEGDTLGGVVEVLAYGLPPGLGSHVHWDRRLDSKLAAALMGIQAIKGVEVGDGFLSARLRGSQVMDEIVRGEAGLTRSKGTLGGTEGGMSSGEVLRVRAAMKPISTVPRALARSTRRQGRRPQRTTSAATSAPSPPRGSSRRRWSRWSWPTWRWRSSAATRWRRRAATARAT
jgi:chorismate synthase